VSTPAARVSTGTYAVTTDSFRLQGAGLDWGVDNVLGRARVQATPAHPGTALFVGIAASGDVARYLSGVGSARIANLDLGWNGGQADTWRTTTQPGGAPATPPTGVSFWQASSSGTGTQTLTWRPSAGDWTIVVMRTDGRAGVTADVRAGATLPGLPWVAGAVLLVGVVLLAIGGLIVALAVHRAATPPPDQVAAPPGPPAPRAPSESESVRARTRT
jgi:hypothetical protein